eukprot:CAMPEP_0171504076 /NCGR_PEP_ID=MMETSP0958-20121227/11329_1 /TAXON_ID=87120 /ORGANISM="Aurantiochytrium limacinum, Strain ATCCMYA-1381" /LENGTH=1041 /DNA_ID=CAMNT_0012039795 /DNA_START=318 /DNA_END=3443 /DNA_ORIENTATION=+
MRSARRRSVGLVLALLIAAVSSSGTQASVDVASLALPGFSILENARRVVAEAVREVTGYNINATQGNLTDDQARRLNGMGCSICTMPTTSPPTPEPTPKPTDDQPSPTPEPTPKPTDDQPSPTPEPTPKPTDDNPSPTPEPTPKPTDDNPSPTPEPTPKPTNDNPSPTPEPTPKPTNDNTSPTPEPTSKPTKADSTAEPTPKPTKEPTSESSPTPEPTAETTPRPTKSPTSGSSPTPQPTAEDTPKPTKKPTTQPSPTPAPTAETTPRPTKKPTNQASPTSAPTAETTPRPTKNPTNQASPTSAPTAEATPKPTKKPTDQPSPTSAPTAEATPKPTKNPTNQPKPTAEPTAKPTAEPTKQPTRKTSTSKPTSKPTREPTQNPTSQPTVRVTSEEITPSPSSAPSMAPTVMPTLLPTSAPTNSTCNNSIWDDDEGESDIDCGGDLCPARCRVGGGCYVASDCDGNLVCTFTGTVLRGSCEEEPEPIPVIIKYPTCTPGTRCLHNNASASVDPYGVCVLTQDNSTNDKVGHCIPTLDTLPPPVVVTDGECLYPWRWIMATVVLGLSLIISACAKDQMLFVQALDLGHIIASGAFLVLPSAPVCYLAFATEMRWSTLVLLPIPHQLEPDESLMNIDSDDDTNGRRLISFSTNLTWEDVGLSRMTQAVGLDHKYLLCGFLILMLAVMLIYAVVQIAMSGINKWYYCIRESAVRIPYMLSYPVIALSAYTLYVVFIAKDADSVALQAGLAFLALAVMIISVAWIAICFRHTWPSDPAKTFRSLHVDWNMRHRLFWCVRVLNNAFRGFFIGLVTQPEPVQAGLFFGVGVLYFVVLAWVKPYEYRSTNWIALVAAFLYVINTTIPIIFAMDPAPFSTSTLEVLGEVQVWLNVGSLFFMLAIIMSQVLGKRAEKRRAAKDQIAEEGKIEDSEAELTKHMFVLDGSDAVSQDNDLESGGAFAKASSRALATLQRHRHSSATIVAATPQDDSTQLSKDDSATSTNADSDSDSVCSSPLQLEHIHTEPDGFGPSHGSNASPRDPKSTRLTVL